MKPEFPKSAIDLTLSDTPLGLPVHDLSSRFYGKVVPALLLPSRHSPEGEAHKALLQRWALDGHQDALRFFEGNTYGLEKYRELVKAHFDTPED